MCEMDRIAEGLAGALDAGRFYTCQECGNEINQSTTKSLGWAHGINDEAVHQWQIKCCQCSKEKIVTVSFFRA